MEKIFYVDQIRKDLQALNSNEISLSKFVEMLNARVSNSNAFKWISFIDEQPNDKENVIVQYKTFEFGEQKYFAKNIDWFIANAVCWLKKM